MRTGHRREQCPTTWKVTGPAGPSDAQSVKASLAWSGTTLGEPRFVPGSASIASELAAKVTTIGWAGSKSLSTSRSKTARGRHDVSDLTAGQAISEDGRDFASLGPNHDRPDDCGSAQGPCRRLRAASREGFALRCGQDIGSRGCKR